MENLAEESFALSPAERFLSTLALKLTAFLFILDYTIANVALPYIAGGLATSVYEGTYVITSFAIGNAIFVPMTGYFSNKFGMICTLILSIFLFTVFSILCAVAPNLYLLVIFRFLQGASAGSLLPLSQGLLVLIQPKEKIHFFMALYALIILVAPAIGPIIGGWICEFFNWRWIFYINLPIGIFSTISLSTILMKFNQKKVTPKLDYLGFLLLFIAMSSLQIFLDRGQIWDWFNSNKILFLCILSFLSLFYLVIKSLYSQDPILDLKLFKIPLFLTSCVVIFFSYSIYFGGVVLIPFWLQTEMNYNALNAGIAIAPIGVGSIAVLFLALKLMPKIGPIKMMIIGFLFMALASEYVRFFSMFVDRYHIMMSRFIMGLGIGFWIIPMMNMAALSLSKQQLASGLGLFHFIRGISGAIGASIYPTLYERRMVRTHANLTSNLNILEYQNNLSLNNEKSLFQLEKMINKQAALISINEVFHLMAVVFFVFALSFSIYVTFYKEKKQTLENLDLSLE